MAGLSGQSSPMTSPVTSPESGLQTLSGLPLPPQLHASADESGHCQTLITRYAQSPPPRPQSSPLPSTQKGVQLIACLASCRHPESVGHQDGFFWLRRCVSFRAARPVVYGTETCRSRVGRYSVFCITSNANQNLRLATSLTGVTNPSLGFRCGPELPRYLMRIPVMNATRQSGTIVTGMSAAGCWRCNPKWSEESHPYLRKVQSKVLST
ncbi:hypothetical protein F4780DRAFT_730594 [Xylariomycetidae sp. FL0641]|nr:hypothetical protein F4780DRAFT_730594 [Xylariomycetidae sp. FL0641]